MYCQFAKAKGGCVCQACGRKVRKHSGEGLIAACKVPGLGDAVAKCLAAVGVTEARWLALKGIVVETPSCGCQKRREKLNRWGRWLASWR